MRQPHIRGVVTALCLTAGLALAACVDERPYPAYSHGVAYAPQSCTNCSYGNWYDFHDGQWHVD